MIVLLLLGPDPQRVSGAVTLSAEMQRVITQMARQRVDRLLEGTSISPLLPGPVVSRWREVLALEEMRLVEKQLEAVESVEVCDWRTIQTLHSLPISKKDFVTCDLQV